MKVVATVVSAPEARIAAGLGADLLEARIDLMEADPARELRSIREIWKGPIILTIRSMAEGGRFQGDAGAWWKALLPLLPFGDIVDVEMRFSSWSPEIRRLGKVIIASIHTDSMPAREDLARVEGELRSYGDIPKIVVQPRDEQDLLELLRFTLDARKPICTGVLGDAFRYARVVLPLFGSEFAYTHVGTEAAPGQFHLRVFKGIMDSLRA